MASSKYLVIFLDYDGTLTPIVNDPDSAFMTQHMREAVRAVASVFPTAIISGRGREKVEQFVQLSELYYAGSHGMDIAVPKNRLNIENADEATTKFQPASEFESLMKEVGEQLRTAIKDIPGASVEDNKFCVSVHFRNCSVNYYEEVVTAVEEVVLQYEGLRITRGRKVLEVRPQINWDKGSALVHLLSMLGLEDKEGDVFCLYIGDDRTDEDAFRVLNERGLGGGILVSSRVKETEGRWTLRDPREVAMFLQRLVAWGQTAANRWHESGGCAGWQMAESIRRKAANIKSAFQVLAPGSTSGVQHVGIDHGKQHMTAASRLAKETDARILGRPPLPH